MRRLTAVSRIASLYFMELSNWRWSWRGMVVLGTVSPIAAGVFLAAASAPLSTTSRERIVVGVVLLALLFENFHRVAGHYAFMRIQGTLEYYEALPVRRWMILLAVMASFFTLSLVPALTTYIVVSIYVDVPLVVDPTVLVPLMLAAIPMSAGAAIIGLKSRSGSEATALATLVTVALMSSGGVLVDQAALPQVLQTVGEVNPIAHAAASMRHLLYADGGISLTLITVAVLTGATGGLWLERLSATPRGSL